MGPTSRHACGRKGREGVLPPLPNICVVSATWHQGVILHDSLNWVGPVELRSAVGDGHVVDRYVRMYRSCISVVVSVVSLCVIFYRAHCHACVSGWPSTWKSPGFWKPIPSASSVRTSRVCRTIRSQQHSGTLDSGLHHLRPAAACQRRSGRRWYSWEIFLGKVVENESGNMYSLLLRVMCWTQTVISLDLELSRMSFHLPRLTR